MRLCKPRPKSAPPYWRRQILRRAAKSRLSDSRTDIYLVVPFLSAGNRGADDLG
jgi:hypothetical protein